jgi:pimeloyl-ACP methyl ester carboxylesterase
VKRPNPHSMIRLAAFLAALCALTATYAQESTPASTVLATKVVVGDHSLYLSCLGEGSPAVVLEAGYGDSSEVWAAVQMEVATFTRVCAYDRAGLGRSLPVGERGVQAVVDDLATLVGEDPVVLVGHSVGGLIATMLAHQRPHRVAGLVLVDSSHPDQFPRLRSRLPRGWLRALDTFFAGTPAFETWDSGLATAQGETPYLRAGSLGDLPLAVLTRDGLRQVVWHELVRSSSGQ